MNKNVAKVTTLLVFCLMSMVVLSYPSSATVRGGVGAREGYLLYIAKTTNEMVLASIERDRKLDFMSAVRNVAKAVDPGKGIKYSISKTSYAIIDQDLPGVSVVVTLGKGELKVTTKGFQGGSNLPLDPTKKLEESSGELINYVVNNLYAKASQIGSMHNRSFLTLGDFQTGLTKIETPKNVTVVFKGNKISVYMKDVPEIKTIITVTKEKISFVGVGMNPTKASL